MKTKMKLHSMFKRFKQAVRNLQQKNKSAPLLRWLFVENGVSLARNSLSENSWEIMGYIITVKSHPTHGQKEKIVLLEEIK